MTAHAETIEGEPPHAHHWDPVNAYHGAKLGMWLFLATEILLFGVLFTSFAIYRWAYLGEFHEASLNLDWKMGGLNTLILIGSSFTAALAVDAAQHGNNKKVVRYFGISIVCGAIFLFIKYLEYSHKAHVGLFPFLPCSEHAKYCWTSDPASLADPSRAVASQYKMYFGLYYCMTMLHALHVIIGMGVMFWVLLKARANRFSEQYYTPVELGALYWHLVDLIWIYLFPLLYLVD